ncbi:hypothetical protein CDL12_05190 [Handroanthus impetiginosus]|uniref:Uncharacterized protein n=1 Tax=Handroanthus impetiginosus TaxID=429701 RepID=A0A2G9HXP1_9LAMI|nr:hypothetical protein CDL12_05190 [Handroanthus impetiginosus]
MVDPFDSKKQFLEFTNNIGFEGKFYALSLQGTLGIMEEINSCLVITRIGKSRAVPSVTARYFKEYSLESNGQILLVFLIYCKTLGAVDKVEVFRLYIPKLSWIKLENLQERVSGDNGWCTYDMESGCVSTGLEAKSLSWNEPTEQE